MILFFNEILSGLISVLTPIIFGKILLDTKIIRNKKDKTLIFIGTMICIYILVYKLTSDELKTMLYFIIYILIFKNIFFLNYKKATFITFVFATIIVISDLTVIFTVTDLFGVSKDYYYNVIAGSLMGNIITYLLVLLITKILRKQIKKVIEIELANAVKIVVLSVLTFICIIHFFYSFVNDFRINQNFISSILIMIFLLIALFIVIKQTVDNNKLKSEYDQLLEFMKTYEVEIEKQHIQHHESKNQLVTIKAKLLDQENNKNVIEYIDSILDENISMNQAYYAKFQYLPSNGLKALFYFKASEAENKGITVTISISPKIKNSLLNDLSTNNFKQLGRIVGVYLDNAIEASSLSNSKSMGIEVYKENDDIKMIITNSFDGEIDPNVGNQIFSTKGKNRGHGLMLVNSIINSNNLFYQKREIRKNVYVQILVVKNKKSI